MKQVRTFRCDTYSYAIYSPDGKRNMDKGTLMERGMSRKYLFPVIKNAPVLTPGALYQIMVHR